MRRTLSLKKETLTELSTAQLDSVIGASGVSCTPTLCAPPSDFVECLTGIQCLTDSCWTGTTDTTR